MRFYKVYKLELYLVLSLVILIYGVVCFMFYETIKANYCDYLRMVDTINFNLITCQK